jgi:hypothetical protein
VTRPLIIYQHRIWRQDLRRNPNIVYVFGDNEWRIGLGGQAREMRGEPNAHGVATLKSPGLPWSDNDFDANCAVINADLRELFDREARVIVFPSDGIGTGLARLNTSAPRTFAYLGDRLRDLFGVENGANT